MRFQARPAPRAGYRRGSCGAVGLTVAALVLGCRSLPPKPAPSPPPSAITATPAVTAPEDPKQTPAREPSGAEPLLDQQTAEAEAARILEEVAKARNLPVTRPVNVDVVDRPGIREFAKQSMYKTTTPEELQLLGRVEASLGIIPRDEDPERIVLDLLEDGVAGFYDPEQKTLFIGDFVDKLMLSMVVGHEIAHGLQDMHFDLIKHQQPLRHRADEETARRFLIEGGAQATYLAWVAGASGLGAIEDGVLDAMGNQVLDMAAVASPYPILVRSLQLPYADGTATVIRLVQRKGWKAIDDLYDRLPESSEQMLHLDKLLSREAPISAKVDVGVIEALLPDTKLAWHDTLGEAELLAMVAQVEPSLLARRAAAGWGGDHYVAVERQGPGGWDVPLVVGVIVWDSEDEAAEFEPVFAKYLKAMVPDHALERRCDQVLFATGIPAEVEASTLVAAAWKGVHVGSRRSKRRRRRKGCA